MANQPLPTSTPSSLLHQQTPSPFWAVVCPVPGATPSKAVKASTIFEVIESAYPSSQQGVADGAWSASMGLRAGQQAFQLYAEHSPGLGYRLLGKVTYTGDNTFRWEGVDFRRDQEQTVALVEATGGFDAPVIVAVDEVLARRALLAKDSGDYERILRRVEGAGGLDAGPPPGCAVCDAHWNMRRGGAQPLLLQHLCTAGHVALEQGLSVQTLEVAVLAKSRGMSLVRTEEKPKAAPTPLADLVEALVQRTAFVEKAKQDKEQKLAAMQSLQAAAADVRALLIDLGATAHLQPLDLLRMAQQQVLRAILREDLDSVDASGAHLAKKS